MLKYLHGVTFNLMISGSAFFIIRFNATEIIPWEGVCDVMSASTTSTGSARATEGNSNRGNSNSNSTSDTFRNRQVGRLVCDGHLRLIEILRVQIVQHRNLPIRYLNNNRSVCVSVRFDTGDVHQSTSSAKSLLYNIGDEFVHEISVDFSQIHFIVLEDSRIPRPIGHVSLKKRDIVWHSSEERWYAINAFSKQPEVFGQIQLDLAYDQATSTISLKVLDLTGLPDGEEPYVLVTLQGCGRTESRKLEIAKNATNERILTMKCGAESVGESRPHMRLSVWQNMQNGYKSRFCGQIRIELDEKTRRPKEEYLGTQWYYLKPRVSLDEPGQEMNPEDTSSSSQIGELCLRLFYTADHVLPMEIYKPLQAYLISSIDVQPFFVSPTGLLEHLPSLDLVVIARPLMKLFIQANQIRPLIRVLCSQEIAKCEDVHMLFRSQSLASKVIYEQLVFVGHQYLVISLKPIIDMIFNDRKNCEIDPAKLSADDSLDQNRVNLLVYGELAVTRLLESFRWCPLQLREMFAEVRRTVSDYYPGREDIQRLAVSSFVIMRFFAAALVSPKLFGLKREHADPMISRTLTLLSKILQRLTNHAVCGRSLSVKEPWLTSILERFISIYKGSMLRFLDKISMENCDVPVSGENALVLRDGFFDERNSKDKKRILKNILHQKRRYVVLTENEIYWQKTKLDPEPKGRIFLQDVNSIEPVVELRNVFRISTPTSDIQFQAQSAAEMNEWIVQIQKQRKRNLLSFYRISEASNVCEIDAERELEAIHMTLYEYAETLKNWKNALEGVEQSENAKLPKYLENMLKSCEDPDAVRRVFLSNLEDLLHGTLLVENTHRNVVNHFLSQIRNERGSRDAQIGDENYLLLKSRFQKSLD